MQKSQIHEFQSDKDLSKAILDHFGLVLVFFFYADWNQESKQFVSKVRSSIPVYGQFENVRYFSISAQRCPDIFRRFHIEKTPSVIFTQSNNKILQKLDTPEIGVVFQELQKNSVSQKVQFENEKAIWHAKIKSYVQAYPYVIYIYGTPENPKCQQTKKLNDVLSKNNIELTYYDISQDQQMRNWCRDYSKCKSYPIAFIHGSAIQGVKNIQEHFDKQQQQKITIQNTKFSKGQQKYLQYINQSRSIGFIDGYTFENSQSERKVEQWSKKDSDIAIVNVNVCKELKKYITQVLKKKLPILVHQRVVLQ